MSKDSLLEDKTDNLRLMAADICLLTVGGWSDFVLMQNGSSFGFLYGWKSPFVKLYIYIYTYILKWRGKGHYPFISTLSLLFRDYSLIKGFY